MGVVFSRWRKKASTMEVLEKLEKDIETIEKQRRSNLERERRLVGSLLLYSILLYTVVTCVIYFYYLPDAWADRMKYSVPLVFFPIFSTLAIEIPTLLGLLCILDNYTLRLQVRIWAVKRFLQWYFVKRISKNEVKLENLREKKKGILDEVMETHTYKKAKEILERFDPSTDKKLDLTEESTPARQKAPEGQELRQRNKGTTPVTGKPSVVESPTSVVAPTPGANLTVGTTPGVAPGSAGRPEPHTRLNTGQQAPQWENSGGDAQQPSSRKYRRTSNSFGTPMRPPGPPMARPVLPRERSASERVLEYLIGDGPQNRYALICRQCHSHNGMAYKEEFDYLNFRCCYCFTFNKARRQRPNAPALKTPPTTHRKLNVNQEPESGTDAEPESGTDVESASDVKNNK